MNENAAPQPEVEIYPSNYGDMSLERWRGMTDDERKAYVDGIGSGLVDNAAVIEVTPAMIAAGASLLCMEFDPEESDLNCFAEKIFRVMLENCREKG